MRHDRASAATLPDVPTLWDSIDPPVIVPAIDPHPDSIQAAFDAFHAANPWVYEALRRLACDLLERGAQRVGVKMLIEVLRWQHARATIDPSSPFKINNNFTSRYARLLLADEHLKGTFDVRDLRTP